jgi:hypothetical protein
MAAFLSADSASAEAGGKSAEPEGLPLMCSYVFPGRITA